MRAALLNCSLKSSDEGGSTEVILGEIAQALAGHDIEVGDSIRAVDHDIRAGVTSDEGDGDDWPAIRSEILGSEILVMGTPIWLGHASSLAQRVLERLDAFLGEEDERGRMISYDRVAIVAVVGNEDGAHHVAAELFQGLSDVGFTIPANGMTYWVGEAMQKVDYRDKSPRPEKTAATTKTAVANAVHLARLLAGDGYPVSTG